MSKLRIGSKTIVIDLTHIPDANIIEHVLGSWNLFAKDDQDIFEVLRWRYEANANRIT